MINKYINLISLFFCFFSFLLLNSADISYKVEFYGLPDKEIYEKIQSSSQLICFKNNPPKSINALHYRAESDVTNIKKVMHFYGYYDSNVKMQFYEDINKIIIRIIIDPGERYTIDSYDIFIPPFESKKKLSFFSNDLNLKKIGINLDGYVTSQDIVNSRLKLLSYFSFNAHPLANIENENIIVDAKEKKMHVDLYVDEGPCCFFGHSATTGLQQIKNSFIDKKIIWQPGEKYSPEKVEETQKRLLNTDLFTSVLITHDNKVCKNNELNMRIQLIESKHKNISLGISYATIERLGCQMGWINRNFRHIGELLSLEASIAQRRVNGLITYEKPDFKKMDQNLVFILQAVKEEIHVYHASTYRFVTRLDRQIDKKNYFSWGVRTEYIDVSHSANNADYTLIGLPCFYKYSTVKDFLNPTQGYSFTYSIVPYSSFVKNKSFFIKQKIINDNYFPITGCFLFAVRLQLGSIIGPSMHKLPMTKLFLGGSDDDLRGYRFHSVSPIDESNNPIGAMSCIFCTFEPRFHITKTIGLVPFFDIGTLSLKNYPNINEKWYKSIGIGFRYYLFFGPLRIDLAFPLDRREDIDDKYRIYVNIGQTF